MSSKFLAIDIKSGLITAIVFTGDAKAMQVTGHAAVPVAARPLDEALAELGQTIDTRDAVCHVAFEARSFCYRNLSLPFTDAKTINRILPLELEENTPVKIDQLLTDFMIAGENRQGSQVMAAMIRRELLAGRLAVLQTLGIDPEVVTISGIPTTLHLLHTLEQPTDFLHLNIDLQEATCIFVRSGHVALVRPLVFDPGLASGFELHADNSITVFRPENVEHTFQTLCTAIRQTLQSSDPALDTGGLAVFLSGSIGSLSETAKQIQAGLGDLCQSCSVIGPDPSWPVTPPPDGNWQPGIMEDALNLGRQIIKNWKGYNFRKEAFATRKSFAGNKNLALAISLPLFAAAMVAILYLWYDYSRLVTKKNDLDAQIQAVFSETLPDVTRIVDPLQQLQVRINEVGQSAMNKDGTLPPATILALLAEVSANIPAPLEIRLARFMVDDSGLRLKGTTDTFNTVDAIKKGLEQSPAFSRVEISAANLDPKSSKIRFELKLTMKGA